MIINNPTTSSYVATPPCETLSKSRVWGQNKPLMINYKVECRCSCFYVTTLCWRGICCRLVSACPSRPFCLSQSGIVSKRLDGLSCFLATMFPLSSFPLYLHCVIRKFGNLQKYGCVHLEVCPQTLDLDNFATTSRSCCLRLPSWSTVELVEHTYTTAVDASWLGRLIFAPTGLVAYTFVDRTARSPLLLLLLYYVITHKVQ